MSRAKEEKFVQEAQKPFKYLRIVGFIFVLLALLGAWVWWMSNQETAERRTQSPTTRSQGMAPTPMQKTGKTSKVERVVLEPGKLLEIEVPMGTKMDYETERSACIVRFAHARRSPKVFMDTICDPGKAPNCREDLKFIWAHLPVAGPLPSQEEPLSKITVALADCGGKPVIQYTYRGIP